VIQTSLSCHCFNNKAFWECGGSLGRGLIICKGQSPEAPWLRPNTIPAGDMELAES